jgi:transmembrane sensor
MQFRFLQWRKYRINQLDRSEAMSDRIDFLLEAQSRRLRAINPETDQQWRLLNVELQRKPGKAKVRRASFRLPVPWPAVSVAAATVLLIAAGIFWLRQPSTTTYETTRGQHSTIALTDSTEVLLNHTSELTVHRWPPEEARRVAMKGEAFFRVRKTGTPFIVSTDVATVRVLGTEFNVRVRDGRMEVAVIKGSVLVSVHGEAADSAIVLAAGQIATCVRDGFPGAPRPLLVAEYPGWMHGKFVFQRTSLVSVCKEIESQFDVTVTIDNPRLRDETITGIVDGRNAESALATLANLTGTKYRHENGSYTLY